MRTSHHIPFISVFVLVFFLLSPLLGAAEGQKSDGAAKTPPPGAIVQLTDVQKTIFDKFHLKNVRPGQTLTYRFERKGLLGDDYKDEVHLMVTSGRTEQARTVGFRFFSGNRRRPYPELSDVTSNPLLTLYFNKDVWDLARRIKARGVANYLRNRILDSLAQASNMQDAVCVLPAGADGAAGSQEVTGKRVVISPYRKDENRHHLVHYSSMQYEIIVSDDVPGGVCEISTVVPFPSEKTPEHFLLTLKKSRMLSLAAEVEKVNKLKTTKVPLIVERLQFLKVSDTINRE